MAWIKTVDPADATGVLKTEYDKAIRRAGKIFEILRIQSLNGESVRDGMRLYLTIMYGPSPLTRGQREMIATVVSAANHCHY